MNSRRFCRTDREYPRKDKLGKGGSLGAGGLLSQGEKVPVHPTGVREGHWFAQAGADLQSLGKQEAAPPRRRQATVGGCLCRHAAGLRALVQTGGHVVSVSGGPQHQEGHRRQNSRGEGKQRQWRHQCGREAWSWCGATGGNHHAGLRLGGG